MASLKLNVTPAEIAVLERIGESKIQEGILEFEDYQNKFKDNVKERILENFNSLGEFLNQAFFISIGELFLPPLIQINPGNGTAKASKKARTRDTLLTMMAVALDGSKRSIIYCNLVSTKVEFVGAETIIGLINKLLKFIKEAHISTNLVCFVIDGNPINVKVRKHFLDSKGKVPFVWDYNHFQDVMLKHDGHMDDTLCHIYSRPLDIENLALIEACDFGVPADLKEFYTKEKESLTTVAQRIHTSNKKFGSLGNSRSMLLCNISNYKLKVFGKLVLIAVREYFTLEKIRNVSDFNLILDGVLELVFLLAFKSNCFCAKK
ncbi:uncharacterized protein LOC111519498 [Drosophila willistoni]|uniref:uncharacterized protein LOC111519498 n=1 Tax=Drosophila willistoni TaxID=7260 RepID=UPI001F087637|nr:uncharacterized protein LOC111519498 [Drosophila willistoni]